jgi:hypothetical protein
MSEGVVEQFKNIVDEYESIDVGVVKENCKDHIRQLNKAKHIFNNKKSKITEHLVKKATSRLKSIKVALKNSKEYMERYFAIKAMLENEDAYTKDQLEKKTALLTMLSSYVYIDKKTLLPIPAEKKFYPREFDEFLKGVPKNILDYNSNNKEEEEEEEEESSIDDLEDLDDLEEEEEEEEEEEDIVEPMESLDTSSRQVLDELLPLYKWTAVYSKENKEDITTPSLNLMLQAKKLFISASKKHQVCNENKVPYHDDLKELQGLFMQIGNFKKQLEKKKAEEKAKEEEEKAKAKAKAKSKTKSKTKAKSESAKKGKRGPRKKLKCPICGLGKGPRTVYDTGYCATHSKETNIEHTIHHFAVKLMDDMNIGKQSESVKEATSVLPMEYEKITNGTHKKSAVRTHATAAATIFTAVFPTEGKISEYFTKYPEEKEKYESGTLMDDEEEGEDDSIVAPDDVIEYEDGIQPMDIDDEEEEEDIEEIEDEDDNFSDSVEDNDDEEEEPQKPLRDDSSSEEENNEIVGVVDIVPNVVHHPSPVHEKKNGVKRKRSQKTLDLHELLEDFMRVSNQLTKEECDEFLSLCRNDYLGRASEFFVTALRKKKKYAIQATMAGFTFVTPIIFDEKLASLTFIENHKSEKEILKLESVEYKPK